MVLLWRITLIFAAAFLVWRIIWAGVSESYAKAAEKGDVAAIDQALAWNPRQPQALYLKARSIIEEDTASATSLLTRAFGENPTSAWPLVSLAALAQTAGQDDQAAALVEKATDLMPTNPSIQFATGVYWVKRGDLDAAMKHWSRSLEASWSESTDLVPVLLKLVEEPRSIGVFRQYAADPPSWWKEFFDVAVRRVSDIDALRTLFAFRRGAKKSPITRDERDVYIWRLQKEGKFAEAYVVWVSGLSDDEQSQLGAINNGSFEIKPTNSGFDWHVQPANSVTVDTGKTAGVKGSKALHLIFKRTEGRYENVYQPLFIGPGEYRGEGMVRTDSLESKGGLKWLVRCLFPKPGELGESPRFLGSSEWTTFSFPISVPEECTAQEIRLVSAGRHEFEYEISGGIWFDAMAMRRIQTTFEGASDPVAEAASPPRESTLPLIEKTSDPLAVTGGSDFQFEPPLTGSLTGHSDREAQAD